MSFQRQVSRALDDEHRASLALLNRVVSAFVHGGKAHDDGLAQLAGTFARHVERDVRRHFDFEERELFPLLAAAGDGDITVLLAEEHIALRAAAAEVLPLALAAEAGTLDVAGWKALQAGSLEMVERLVAHIQKETRALVPTLEDLLDDDTDRALAFAYACV
jgi:iron-sulfur cluster repair protein YtfE (RIC family)